uniref:RNA polymerase beta'' subunit n=1 Tax=Chlamydomonas chlamydogama TaxID=225041 RepID=UPI00226CF950|nr:RNA polymerase beta'' subunit [Chlamydomonas chlamydogama]UZA61970.1 RNA polymerase beta'' subunit [Chlamydomonas chlamydogama]
MSIVKNYHSQNLYYYLVKKQLLNLKTPMYFNNSIFYSLKTNRQFNCSFKTKARNKNFLYKNFKYNALQKLNALEKSKPNSHVNIDALKLNHAFWNQTFDKGRLKNFVLWFLLNNGEHKTVQLVEELKNLGFQYATKAGISLSIEDLKIPPKKTSLLLDAECETFNTENQYNRGEITGVERFQRLIDTWHRTSERLKQEVIDYFEATDILNPVYMMAFSGARGNISQVRQLVGMRGLMSNPQGQIIDFPIRSNFREGLTLTEYIISTYGARKGIVDTALRTANAGYLTRRLVDVAQHVIISNFDCGTKRGIFLMDMKEGNKTIYSLQNRLVGRILARDIYNFNNKEKQLVASKNQEVSVDLALKITQSLLNANTFINAQAVKNNSKKVFVRSPLTCETKKLICQLCYGWSLAQGNLVSIGEAVGVVAAQSIGEPGTQLTMRTFHTGGVFSGDISEQLRAPFNGIVQYTNPIPGTLIRTPEGKIAFLTKSEGSFKIYKNNLVLNTKQNLYNSLVSPMNHNLESKLFKIPYYTLLFVRNGESVLEKEVVAQISTISRQKNLTDQAEFTIKSDLEGQFYSKTLDLQETKIGPKQKKEEIVNDSVMDIIYQSWNWGYAWILSGKVYQLDLPSFLFPYMGDYVNKKTIMNQISWTIPLSFKTQFKLQSLHPNSSFKTSFYFNKFLKQKSACQIVKKDILLKPVYKMPMIVSDIFSLNIQKMFYKKIGYSLNLTNTRNAFDFGLKDYSLQQTKTLKNSILSPNDSLFLLPSFTFKHSLVDHKPLSPSNWLPKFEIFLNWFPAKYQTLSGGLLFIDPDFQYNKFLSILKNTNNESSIYKSNKINALNSYDQINKSKKILSTWSKFHCKINNQKFHFLTKFNKKLKNFKTKAFKYNFQNLDNKSSKSVNKKLKKHYFNNSKSNLEISNTSSFDKRQTTLKKNKELKIKSFFPTYLKKSLLTPNLKTKDGSNKTIPFDNKFSCSNTFIIEHSLQPSLNSKTKTKNLVAGATGKERKAFGMSWNDSYKNYSNLSEKNLSTLFSSKLSHFEEDKGSPFLKDLNSVVSRSKFKAQSFFDYIKLFWIPQKFYKILLTKHILFSTSFSNLFNNGQILSKSKNQPLLFEINRQGKIKFYYIENGYVHFESNTLNEYLKANKVSSVCLNYKSNSLKTIFKKYKNQSYKNNLNVAKIKTNKVLNFLKINLMTTFIKEKKAKNLKGLDKNVFNNNFNSQVKLIHSESYNKNQKIKEKAIQFFKDNVFNKKNLLNNAIKNQNSLKKSIHSLRNASFFNANVLTLKTYSKLAYIYYFQSTNRKEKQITNKNTHSKTIFNLFINTTINNKSNNAIISKNFFPNFINLQFKFVKGPISRIKKSGFLVDFANHFNKLSLFTNKYPIHILEQTKAKRIHQIENTLLKLIKINKRKYRSCKKAKNKRFKKLKQQKINSFTFNKTTAIYKKGWPYVSKDFSSFYIHHKNFIAPGKNIKHHFLFNNHKLYIEFIKINNNYSFSTFNFDFPNNPVVPTTLNNMNVWLKNVNLDFNKFKIRQKIKNTYSRFQPTFNFGNSFNFPKLNPFFEVNGIQVLNSLKNLNFIILLRNVQEYKLSNSNLYKKEIYKLSTVTNYDFYSIKKKQKANKNNLLAFTNKKAYQNLVDSILIKRESVLEALKLKFPSKHYDGLLHQLVMEQLKSKNKLTLNNFQINKTNSIFNSKISLVPDLTLTNTKGFLKVITKLKFTIKNIHNLINRPYFSLFIKQRYKLNSFTKQKITTQLISKYPASDIHIINHLYYFVCQSINTQIRQEKIIKSELYPSYSEFNEILKDTLGDVNYQLNFTKVQSIGQNNLTLGVKKLLNFKDFNLPVISRKPVNLFSFSLINKTPYDFKFPFKKRHVSFSSLANIQEFNNLKKGFLKLSLNSFILKNKTFYSLTSMYKNQTQIMNKNNLGLISSAINTLFSTSKIHYLLVKQFDKNVFLKNYKTAILNTILESNPQEISGTSKQKFNTNYKKLNNLFDKTEFCCFDKNIISAITPFLKTHAFSSFEGEIIYQTNYEFNFNKFNSITTLKNSQKNKKKINNKKLALTSSSSLSTAGTSFKKGSTKYFNNNLQFNSDYQWFNSNPYQNSCLILTKTDLIAYYFAQSNYKHINENLNYLKKKNQYIINNVIIKSQSMLEITNENQVANESKFNNDVNQYKKINKLTAGPAHQTNQLLLGNFVYNGDTLSDKIAIPKSGQIIHINYNKITLRKGKPLFISPKTILHKYDGDFIYPQTSVITLSYQQLKTGDIIQGIPKVEQFFEARTTKRGRLFRDNLSNLLKGLFKRYYSKLPLEQAVRQSFYKIQQIIVDGVQRVYRSQGVTIADKHLEVIVKQMTSKVKITEGGQTGFFPGEIVDLYLVEEVNHILTKKVQYEPLVLGITRASLEVDSFLSAASFQQTTKVLSKAALSRKKDFLKGLKENVILGNLIPAGTGYLLYLDDQKLNS